MTDDAKSIRLTTSNVLAIRDTNSSIVNCASKKEEDQNPKNRLILTDSMRFECGVCISTLYNAMSVYPCLHSFCCGCISRWHMENARCPICRVPSSDLVINREVRELVDKFVEQNPDRRRTQEDKVELDGYEMRYLEDRIKNSTSLTEYAFRFGRGTRSLMHSDIQRYKSEKEKELMARYLKLRQEKIDRNEAVSSTIPQSNASNANDILAHLEFPDNIQLHRAMVGTASAVTPIRRPPTPGNAVPQRLIAQQPQQEPRASQQEIQRVLEYMSRASFPAPVAATTVETSVFSQIRRVRTSAVPRISNPAVSTTRAANEVTAPSASVQAARTANVARAIPNQGSQNQPNLRRRQFTNNDEEPFVPRRSARLAQNQLDRAARN